MKRFALILCGILTVGLADRQGAAWAETPAASASSDAQALPSDPDGLTRLVVAAMRDHDQAALERLVNWDGVRPLRRRLTLFQISTGFGRPIKQAVLEDMPADALDEAQSRGTLKPNMAVTNMLRLVFDEPPDDTGAQPTNVFLIGKKDGVFRIAILNSTGTGRK